MNTPLYTTVEAEIRRMELAAKRKLEMFRPARHCSIADEIFHLFKSSSRAHLTTTESVNIYKVIAYYLKKEAPIKVSFLRALYWMSESPWKFLEYRIINPRLGGYFAPQWFSLLNAKLKTIFPSGCEFYIIDEFEMVREMGWTRAKRNEREALLRPVYAPHNFIKVFDLKIFSSLPDVIEPGDENIAATVIATPRLINALPEDTIRTIMDMCYLAHNTATGQVRLHERPRPPYEKEVREQLLVRHKKMLAR